jgi:CDP-diacylglycerol--glycerol-3-phosphate 3-phosphatidyltransferase
MSDPVIQVSTEIEKTELDKFWTVSNAVSVLRIVLTLPVVWLIALGPIYMWPTFGLVVVMIISDMLDGYLARRRNEITRWGKILDPMADKVAIGAITVVLVLFKGLPFWVVAAVLVRDGLILLASMFLVGRRDVVISSNIWGKLTTFMMSLLLVSFLMDIHFIQSFMLWICGGLLFVSWASYLWDFIQIMN